jgi:hypothetical protein
MQLNVALHLPDRAARQVVLLRERHHVLAPGHAVAVALLNLSLDKNRRDIGQSQSTWTDPKMEMSSRLAMPPASSWGLTSSQIVPAGTRPASLQRSTEAWHAV